MTQLQQHLNVRSSVGRLLTRPFSRHPERYLEMLRIARKHELHHVAAELSASRQPEEDADGVLIEHEALDDDHPDQLASALEELGPCFIKLGQLLSTRPDLLPPDYIRALARLQDTIVPVPAASIVQIVEHELGAPLATLFQSWPRTPPRATGHGWAAPCS